MITLKNFVIFAEGFLLGISPLLGIISLPFVGFFLYKGNKKHIGTMVSILFLLSVVPTLAQENAGADVNYKSRYIWKGIPQEKNAMLYDAWYSTGDAKIQFITAPGVQEYDVVLSYSQKYFNFLKFNPTFTLYSMNSQVENELMIDLGIDIKRVSIGHRLSLISGISNYSYVTYTGPIGEWVTIGLGFTNPQFNEHFAKVKESLNNVLYVGGGINYKVLDQLTVCGSMGIYRLNEKITNDINQLNIGVGLQYSLK